MAEYVVIRLGRGHNPVAEWIVADDNGTRRSQPSKGALEEAAAEVQGRPVIVLLPATETLTTVVGLPMRAGNKLNAALPYALEEQVAVDVDTMHFAAGDKRESGMRPVAAVAREQLDRWLEQLEEAGITPWKMVPETYGLARLPGTLSVLVDGDCVFFNDGEDAEFVIQGATPSDALVAAGQLADRPDDVPPDPSGHLVVYCDAADEERLSHDWIALRHELHSVDINLLPDGALPRLAVTVASGQGVNLLQGRYGPKADYGSWLRPWSKAAVLLLALLIAGCGQRRRLLPLEPGRNGIARTVCASVPRLPARGDGGDRGSMATSAVLATRAGNECGAAGVPAIAAAIECGVILKFRGASKFRQLSGRRFRRPRHVTRCRDCRKTTGSHRCVRPVCGIDSIDRQGR